MEYVTFPSVPPLLIPLVTSRLPPCLVSLDDQLSPLSSLRAASLHTSRPPDHLLALAPKDAGTNGNLFQIIACYTLSLTLPLQDVLSSQGGRPDNGI